MKKVAKRAAMLLSALAMTVCAFAFIPYIPQTASAGGAPSYAVGQTLADIALKEYNAHPLGEGDKYWTWAGWDFKVEWCAMFVSWCADQAGMLDKGLMQSSIWADAADFGITYKSANTYTPQVGDIIIYDWYNHRQYADAADAAQHGEHVGIVVAVDTKAGTVTTVEGNGTIKDDQGNKIVDGKLIKRTSKLTWEDIKGYGVPNYQYHTRDQEPSVSDYTRIATDDGFDIIVSIKNIAALSSVRFPTWTSSGGQDDIVWHIGTINRSAGTATFHVKRSDHKNEYGEYVTHIYLYDQYGNSSAKSLGGFVLSEPTTTSTTEETSTTTETVAEETTTMLKTAAETTVTAAESLLTTETGEQITTMVENETTTTARNTARIGDLDGNDKVDTRDAMLLYIAVCGEDTLSDEQIGQADLNGDGLVNMQDAMLLYQVVSGDGFAAE